MGINIPWCNIRDLPATEGGQFAYLFRPIMAQNLEQQVDILPRLKGVFEKEHFVAITFGAVRVEGWVGHDLL